MQQDALSDAYFTPQAMPEDAGSASDPMEVIQFLLGKVDEQAARLAELEGYAELMGQELDGFRDKLGEAQAAKLLAEHQVVGLKGELMAFEAELRRQGERNAELTAEATAFAEAKAKAEQELTAALDEQEVMLQNALVLEQELEALKAQLATSTLQAAEAQAKPTISLPFHTRERLAQLGYQEPAGKAAEAQPKEGWRASA